jgi:hypothetical protein
MLAIAQRGALMKRPLIQNNDKDIAKVLTLLKHSDSVELKLTVPESDQRSALMALDLDILGAEFRQVVFFDTPDLKLNRSGLMMRARRIRGGGDSTVKVRPVQPAELSRTLRKPDRFTVEVDAMPGAFVCSGSLKAMVDNSDVKRVLMGKRPIRDLFTAEQRDLYQGHAPKGLTLGRLTPFGPINAAKLKFSPKAFSRSLVVEVWFYPDGSRMLELSTKCAPDEAFHAAAEMRAYLKGRGINMTGTQDTKTRKALHYFSHLHNGKRPA